ncbi:hypothetical protein GGI12_000653 [Dipsacomyces acuminosporus]|nr:hypothetical protein GGI12_000653 [Dipsacomyces acuminosporus]
MLVRLRARKRCNKDVLQRKSRRKVSIVGVSKKRPVIISVPRYSAIDSEAVSHASSADGRGLFSQSMYNVHRWATSIFGISSAGNGLAGKGLRVKAIRDSAGCRTSGCHRIDMQGSVSEGDGEGRQDQPRLSISLSVAKVSRSYYERFKRSIANSIVRRFIIATDIPSPTIPSAIFDDICGASAADGNSPSLTHCDVRSSTESVADEVDTTQNSAYPMSSDINVAMSWGQDAGGRSNLKRCVKVRENSLNDEPSEDGNTASKENHRDSSPGIGQGSVSDCSLSCEGRCGDDRSQHGRSNLSVRSDDSVQLVDAQEIEGFESLEEGHWLTTVAQCRNIRGGNEEKGAKGSQEDKLYVTRMYVYPLAYVLVWLPSIFYYVLSTYIYYTAFEAKPSHHRGHSVHKRSRDMARLPAHWTSEQSMNRAWTPYQHATAGVWGSHHISWLAIIQGVHLLNGALDALLFWITER